MFVLLILHNDGIYFVGKDVAEMLEYANLQNFNVPAQCLFALLPFRIKETVIQHSDGHVMLHCTPKCIGKG